MRIWISKPFYEILPYLYLIAGFSLLAAAVFLDIWYWPTICLVAGVFSLILGLMVLLRRRDFRNHPRSRD
ncbi:MAG: hypothetical protein ACR2QG_13465 [Gammaproteobacteria bacterium]